MESNRENGLGRSDITIKDRKNRRAVVIETKVTDSENKLDAACDSALEQIADRLYASAIEQSGYKQVISFGNSFYKKQCRVKVAS